MQRSIQDEKNISPDDRELRDQADIAQTGETASCPSVADIETVHDMKSSGLAEEQLEKPTGSMTPPMSPQEKVEYWLAIADYDLKSAKGMQKIGQFLHVGYMCQQTVEKALKACIAKTGDFPPKTHKLILLAEKANLTSLLTEDQKQLLRDLYTFNIESRYPSYKSAIARILDKRTSAITLIKQRRC